MGELLGSQRVQSALAELDGWQGDEKVIRKIYELPDFRAAIAFVNRVADAAEAMNHHPDISISYDTVTLAISSHAKGGVTDDCIELARAADAAR